MELKLHNYVEQIMPVEIINRISDMDKVDGLDKTGNMASNYVDIYFIIGRTRLSLLCY